jgi:hypothetical protein
MVPIAAMESRHPFLELLSELQRRAEERHLDQPRKFVFLARVADGIGEGEQAPIHPTTD